MRIADMHCDTIRKIHYSNGMYKLYENNLHLDIARMVEQKYCLQNFALFIDLNETLKPCQETLEMLETFRRELSLNADRVRQVFCAEDLIECAESGVIAAVLAVEEGGTLEGKIENLHLFYDKGVRMMNLTWNYKNEIGSPNLCWKQERVPDFGKRNEEGLSSFGMDVIAEMERLGMIIDVSHLSDGGFWDIVNNTHRPFAASHSNAASICGVSRNLTDDMIRAVAEHGGIIGLNFCEDFIQFPGTDTEEPLIDTMVDHMKHIVQTGGTEVLGLGSDFDGIPGNRDITNVGDMRKLISAMEQAEFTFDEIEKICWKNVHRFYKDAL